MENSEIIDQLANAIAERVIPQFPITIDLWSSKECAAYLKISVSHFLQRIACRPDFPPAIRLPTADRGKGQPRWKAHKVINWANRHEEAA